MSAIFVTGATGTVGSSVVSELRALREHVVAGTRRPSDEVNLPAGTSTRPFDFIMSLDEMHSALAGCDRLFLMRPAAIADVERSCSH